MILTRKIVIRTVFASLSGSFKADADLLWQLTV